MSEYDFDAPYDSAQTEAREVYAQARREEEAAEARAQYLNFAILVGIFVVVVLVVALAAPFISQRVVAAVLGENLPQTVIINEVMEEEAVPVEEDVVEETNMEETAVEEEAPSAEEASPSAETEPQIHTVQSGDTLYSIARQYEVSVDDIIDANSIPNPDNIPVGTELTIPDPKTTE